MDDGAVFDIYELFSLAIRSVILIIVFIFSSWGDLMPPFRFRWWRSLFCPPLVRGTFVASPRADWAFEGVVIALVQRQRGLHRKVAFFFPRGYTGTCKGYTAIVVFFE